MILELLGMFLYNLYVVFLTHLAKGHVSFCHHLASIVVRPSVVNFHI
jgi:hypothetical protein